MGEADVTNTIRDALTTIIGTEKVVDIKVQVTDNGQVQVVVTLKNSDDSQLLVELINTQDKETCQAGVLCRASARVYEALSPSGVCRASVLVGTAVVAVAALLVRF